MNETNRGVIASVREAATRSRTRWLDNLLGTTQRVLVEGPETGHSEAFAPVAIAGMERGQILRARITGRDGGHLVGIRA